ncbi:cytochrome d ubiquinol oxidase subunit II [Aquicoccus sp. SCR17]|nr:cytochrome d ubiquinol oxidase subunit II [Carideicomes alvinocaridis]
MSLGVSFDLTVIWALLLVAAVYIYVALDGFDLGIGILYAVFPEKRDRDLLMNSVAPVWDGNETWLVLGGGGLMAAFPMAFGILMTALYPLIILMLLALVLRGVAFEFRWRAQSRVAKHGWDAAFAGGSLVAALAQGMTLGALVQGIEVSGRTYAGGWWDWLTPFTLLCGLAVAAGYTMLGICWLMIKSQGAFRARIRRWGLRVAVVLVGAIVLVSLATPFLVGTYYMRWFAWPGLALSAPVPILVAVLAVLLVQSLRGRFGGDWVPMALAQGLFLLCFLGLGISLWPNVIPPDVSIWEAAAPEKSQVFMLVGAGILLPIILGYTAYAYWVFRGKIDPDEGYH